MKAKHILKEILTAHHEGNSKTALIAMMKQDLMAFSETVKARKITQPLGMIALLRDHYLKWNSVLLGLREAVQGFTYDNNLFLRLLMFRPMSRRPRLEPKPRTFRSRN